jgi:hypothetical protein
MMLIIIRTFVLFLNLLAIASTTFHPDPFRFTAADHSRTASRHDVSPSINRFSTRQDAAQEIRLSRPITSCCASHDAGMHIESSIPLAQVTSPDRVWAGSHSKPATSHQAIH